MGRQNLIIFRVLGKKAKRRFSDGFCPFPNFQCVTTANHHESCKHIFGGPPESSELSQAFPLHSTALSLCQFATESHDFKLFPSEFADDISRFSLWTPLLLLGTNGPGTSVMNFKTRSIPSPSETYLLLPFSHLTSPMEGKIFDTTASSELFFSFFFYHHHFHCPNLCH